jgi:hypothetical protein
MVNGLIKKAFDDSTAFLFFFWAGKHEVRFGQIKTSSGRTSTKFEGHKMR